MLLKLVIILTLCNIFTFLIFSAVASPRALFVLFSSIFAADCSAAKRHWNTGEDPSR